MTRDPSNPRGLASGRTPRGLGIGLEIALVAILLAFGVILLYVPPHTTELRFDCAAYLAQSINIAEGLGNTLDMGGETLPGFYPPGYPAFTALFHWILGPDPYNGVTANFTAGLLTLLAVYALGRKLAGPPAGLLSGLLLLTSFAFRHVAHRLFSQMPSLLVVSLVGILVAHGWRAGGWGAAGRFLAGFLAGIAVLIRSSNVVLAPALALVSLLAKPPPERSRLGMAAPLWIGAGAAGLFMVLYNLNLYGSPMATGYMAWGFELESSFSLKYLFTPTFIHLDEAPWQLVRSVFGFGLLYAWPVALLVLVAAIPAWRFRKARPELWRTYLAMLSNTALMYVFLGLYFFRSPIYSMLTLPLIMPCAAAGLVALVLPGGMRGTGTNTTSTGDEIHGEGEGFGDGDKPKGASVIRTRLGLATAWGACLITAGCLVPGVLDSALLDPEGVKPTWEAKFFSGADETLEPDAVLVGSANPVLVEYFLLRGTERRYLYVSGRAEKQFRRLISHELKNDRIVPAEVEAYVKEHLAAGRNVYFCSLLPSNPGDTALFMRIFKFLRKRFVNEVAGQKDLLRFVKPRPPGPESGKRKTPDGKVGSRAGKSGTEEGGNDIGGRGGKKTGRKVPGGKKPGGKKPGGKTGGKTPFGKKTPRADSGGGNGR